MSSSFSLDRREAKIRNGNCKLRHADIVACLQVSSVSRWSGVAGMTLPPPPQSNRASRTARYGEHVTTRKAPHDLSNCE